MQYSLKLIVNYFCLGLIQIPDFKVNLFALDYQQQYHMRLHCLLIIIISSILSVNALYQQQPAYQFMGLNLTQKHVPYSMILSNDEDKVAFYFLNASTQRPQYKILRFDGSQRCRRRVSYESQVLIGWPKGNNLMFSNKSQTQVTMLGTDCDDPFVLGDFASVIKGAKYSTKSQESYGAFLSQSNEIYEYNLGSRMLQKVYKPQGDQRIISYEYSYNHRYMFIQVSQKGTYNESRVRVYQTDSGRKVKDIASQMMMVKVIERGDYYLGVVDNKLYKVDTTGKAQMINQFTEYDQPLGFCTSEDVLVSIQTLKEGDNQQIVNLVIYSSEDGRVKQTIQLDYSPIYMRQTVMACNDNYLSFMDNLGYIRVYKYNYEFPVLIVVTAMICSILVIAVIVALLVMRRINKQKQQQFYNNLQESPSIITIQPQ